MNAASTERSGVTDAGLVHRALAGDQRAFGELVERYHRLAAAVTFGVLGDLDERDDAVQEGFVRAWNDLSRLKEPSSFKPWLCGIMRHCALTLLRRRPQPERKHESTPQGADLAGGDTIPDEKLALDEEAALLGRLVLALPASYREPLILFYWEDQHVDKVADLLGLSPDAVKQRLARGRELLRERIQSALGSALERRRPSRHLVATVLAALPFTRPTAQAASGPAGRGWAWPAAALVSAIGGFLAGQVSEDQTLPRSSEHSAPFPPMIRHEGREIQSETPAVIEPQPSASLDEGLVAALRDEEPASSFRRCVEVVSLWPVDDFAGAVRVLREHASEGQMAWAAPLFAALWSARAPEAALLAFENDGGTSAALAMSEAMAVWTRSDPAAVQLWLASRLDEPRAACTQEAWLTGIASVEPEIAHRWRERFFGDPDSAAEVPAPGNEAPELPGPGTRN